MRRARTGDVDLDGFRVDVRGTEDGHDASADASVEAVGGPGLPEAQVHARPVPPPRTAHRRVRRLPRLRQVYLFDSGVCDTIEEGKSP